LLKHRIGLSPPIQMCDASSRNVPKEFETLLANCLTHGRRQFVDVLQSFPEECSHVLEILSEVYKNDEIAKKQNMEAEERLHFHQDDSGPLMEDLNTWFHKQIDQHLVEPNSGLGQAIAYMLNHWEALTLFLREPGAPLDKKEAALKKLLGVGPAIAPDGDPQFDPAFASHEIFDTLDYITQDPSNPFTPEMLKDIIAWAKENMDESPLLAPRILNKVHAHPSMTTEMLEASLKEFNDGEYHRGKMNMHMAALQFLSDDLEPLITAPDNLIERNMGLQYYKTAMVLWLLRDNVLGAKRDTWIGPITIGLLENMVAEKGISATIDTYQDHRKAWIDKLTSATESEKNTFKARVDTITAAAKGMV
jgi:hypothetical protein